MSLGPEAKVQFVSLLNDSQLEHCYSLDLHEPPLVNSSVSSMFSCLKVQCV